MAHPAHLVLPSKMSGGAGRICHRKTVNPTVLVMQGADGIIPFPERVVRRQTMIPSSLNVDCKKVQAKVFPEK